MLKSSTKKIQFRLLAALFTVAILSTTGVALWIGWVSDKLEQELLDSVIHKEADYLDELLSKNPEAKLTQSATFLTWVEAGPNSPLPQPLTDMGLGTHHEVSMGGNKYHVLRRQSPHGIMTLAMEINAIEESEEQIASLLLAVTIFTPFTIFILSWYISKRIVAPINILSSTLASRSPTKKNPLLSPMFEHSELGPVANAVDIYEGNLQTALERERQFCSAASHELRSPLSVVRSSLELLAEQSSSSEQKKPLLRSMRATSQMQTIIDGLLTLVRQEPIPTVKADIIPTIKSVIKQHESEFFARGIKLDYQLPNNLILQALPSHVSIIVSNFLRNALYHMKPIPSQAPCVEIIISAQQIKISDNGETPDVDELENAFNWGQRKPESQGSGLGLYIVNQIAELQGWTAKAKPRHPNGSEFSIHF